MGMQYLEQEFSKGRKPGDTERAKIMSAMIEGRGEDIPLPIILIEQGLVRQDTKHDPSAARDLVFRGAGTEGEILTTSPEKLEAEGSNLGVLQGRIHEVTAPYHFLFLDKLPPSEKRLATLLHRNKRRVKKWSGSERIKDLNMHYDYQLGYKRNHVGNKLEDITLRLGSQHDNWESSSPRLHIKFDNSQISHMIVWWRGHIPKALSILAEDNDLGEFLNNYMKRLDGSSFIENSFAFSLQNSPAVVVQARNTDYVKAIEMDNVKFDAERNVFVRYGVIRKETDPREMTTDTFIGIVESILLLIPTVDLEGK